jgi:hypothetical protein
VKQKPSGIAATWLLLGPLLLGAPLVLSWASPASAGRIEGVDFPERVSVEGVDLELQGLALLRYKIFFKGYVAALYLDPGEDRARVLGDVPRRLEIEYFWSIPAALFAEATIDGIRKNVDADRFRELGPQIERFNALYADIAPGDRYQLTYLPRVGTELALNGSPLGRVEGADFAAALFSIWLGDEPFSESMKEQLLAKPGTPAPPSS